MYTDTFVVSKLVGNFNTSLRVLSFLSIILHLGNSCIDIFRLLQKDFPALHSISIQEPKETTWGGEEAFVNFPLLASGPTVPDSTVNGFLSRRDSRLFNAIESPIRLTHALDDPGEARLVGFQYQGSDVSAVQDIAADAAVAPVPTRAMGNSRVPRYTIMIRGTPTLLKYHHTMSLGHMMNQHDDNN